MLQNPYLYFIPPLKVRKVAFFSVINYQNYTILTFSKFSTIEKNFRINPPPKLRVSPPLQKCSKFVKKKLFFGNSEVKLVLNRGIRDENHFFAILGVK